MENWIPLKMKSAEGYQVIKEGKIGETFDLLILFDITNPEREIRIPISSIERHLILKSLSQNKSQSIYDLLGGVLKEGSLKIKNIFLERKEKARIKISREIDFVCNSVDAVIIAEKESIPLFGKESLFYLGHPKEKMIEKAFWEAVREENFEKASILKQRLRDLKRKKYE